MKLPSTFSAVFVDEKFNFSLPSMKWAVFVDENTKFDSAVHENARKRGWQLEADANQASKQVLIVNYHQDDIWYILQRAWAQTVFIKSLFINKLLL